MATFCLFSVLVLIPLISCIDLESHTMDWNEDAYTGLTDREIILILVKRIDFLEKWNRNQQHDLDTIRPALRQQRRKLDQQGRILRQHFQRPYIEQGTIAPTNDSVVEPPTKNFVGDVETYKRNSHIVLNKRKTVIKSLKDGHIAPRQVEANTPLQVAFYATANHHLHDLGPGQPLEFENVTTNIGNAYNPDTGIFTVPYPGTYVFSVSLLGAEKNETRFYVSKNGAEISWIYIHGTESPYTTSSHTVILQLNENDDIEIRNGAAGNDVWGNGYSCFSGFLLYQKVDAGVIIG